MSTPKLYCFMYSDSQIDEKRQVNAAIGRDFQCGEVSIGANQKKFTDMITVDMLTAFTKQYPDAKIVYKGFKSKTIYRNPTSKFIGSGKE